MDRRRFRALHRAGASIAEIARETGHDWKTVKKYLAEDAPASPPRAPSRAGTQPRVIAPYVDVVDAWLRADIGLRASVIYERLVAEHGFTGSYQRVKMYVAQARPRVADALDAGDENRLVGLHRRFETVAGAQAQVDWGDEGGLLAHVGIPKVYSFHLTLSYSRDTFSLHHQHRPGHVLGVSPPRVRAFGRGAGVDRLRPHQDGGPPACRAGSGGAAASGGGRVRRALRVRDRSAAYRPTGKGRVERQVLIVREHVIAGRSFDSLAELDAAFLDWVPIRRAQVHRTHGEVIGVRAAVDHAALRPLPAAPYLVDDRHLRRVGKDCLVSFEASLYSVPARRVRPGQRVELRVSPDTVAVHALEHDRAGSSLLAAHPRAGARGSWVVDASHWEGLPDGQSRATVIELPRRHRRAPCPPERDDAPLAALLAHRRGGDVTVAHRPLTAYQTAADTTPQTRA